MKTFKDLEFKEHSVAIEQNRLKQDTPEVYKRIFPDGDILEMDKAQQSIITFDNGIRLSIVFGKCFYSNGVDTYEAMVLGDDNEPEGYLTEEALTKYMIELQGKDNV